MGCLPFGKKKKVERAQLDSFLWVFVTRPQYTVHILVSILSYIAVAAVHFFIRNQP